MALTRLQRLFSNPARADLPVSDTRHLTLQHVSMQVEGLSVALIAADAHIIGVTEEAACLRKTLANVQAAAQSQVRDQVNHVQLGSGAGHHTLVNYSKLHSGAVLSAPNGLLG